MSVELITMPMASAPNVFAAPTINHLNAHAINVNRMTKISNGYVRQGAMFCIGGNLFAANSDTAIGGSNTLAIAVKFTVSGTVATPSYVNSLAGVTWNGSYHGWYDVGGNYYERLYWPGNTTFNPFDPSPDWGALNKKRYISGNYAVAAGGGDSALTLIISSITGTVKAGMDFSTAGTPTCHVFLNGALVYQSSFYDFSLFVDLGDVILIRTDTTTAFTYTGSAGLSGCAPEDTR